MTNKLELLFIKLFITKPRKFWRNGVICLAGEQTSSFGEFYNSFNSYTKSPVFIEKQNTS